MSMVFRANLVQQVEKEGKRNLSERKWRMGEGKRGRERGRYLDDFRATCACAAEQACDDATNIELAVFVGDNAVKDGRRREGVEGREGGRRTE